MATLDASAFRELVSGGRRGIGAALARSVLRVAEVPYTLIVNHRNRRFDEVAAAVERVGVPVVSVGNLTMGGTGKTPMVKWIAHWLAKRSVRVAVVSRGYRAKAGEKNDEALELEQSLPEVAQVQNPDRVAGARAAIEQFDSQLILLDDGFQHRRLARDLDVVLLDASAPFGFEHVFPRGMLREPIAGLKRAHVVCLTRADQLEMTDRESIRRRVAQLAPQAAWCEAAHAPHKLRGVGGQTQPVATLAGRRVAAFCGIGNPTAFRHTLEELGASIVYWREFPDHHAYSPGDQAALSTACATSGAELVLATHKDLVKMPVEQLGGRPFWALVIEMRFLAGGAALEQSLRKLAPSA